MHRGKPCSDAGVMHRRCVCVIVVRAVDVTIVGSTCTAVAHSCGTLMGIHRATIKEGKWHVSVIVHSAFRWKEEKTFQLNSSDVFAR